MTTIPEPEHVVMANHVTAMLTAHEAVKQGIATHAQKEEVARDTRRRELEASRRLTAGQVTQPNGY